MKSIRTTTHGKEYYLKLKRFGFDAVCGRFAKTFGGEIMDIDKIVDTLRDDEKIWHLSSLSKNDSGYWCYCWGGKRNGFEWKMRRCEVENYWEIIVLVYNEETKVKVFEDYESYYLWSEALEDVPGVSKYIPIIAPNGNILHAQVAIKCDCLSTALREATEIYSEYPAIANAIQKIATKGKASNGGELIHYTDRYDDGCACKTEDGYNIFAKHNTEEESVLASREECHRAMERIFSKINAKSKAELKTRMGTETTEEDETQTEATEETTAETNEEIKEETTMNEIKKLNLNQLVKRLHELSAFTKYEADPIKRDEMRKEEQMIRNHLEEFEKWSGMSVKYRIVLENGTLYDCYYLEPKGGDDRNG